MKIILNKLFLSSALTLTFFDLSSSPVLGIRGIPFLSQTERMVSSLVRKNPCLVRADKAYGVPNVLARRSLFTIAERERVLNEAITNCARTLNHLDATAPFDEIPYKLGRTANAIVELSQQLQQEAKAPGGDLTSLGRNYHFLDTLDTASAWWRGGLASLRQGNFSPFSPDAGKSVKRIDDLLKDLHEAVQVPYQSPLI